MAKRRREQVSEVTITAEEFYTAFVDTSLGTHLAMIIYSSDTVSDLKKKIVLEHSQLFPRIGEIKVLSLQVKRKGHFYHLPDSMLIFSAYEGSKRHKFLFVDASSSEEDDREQHSSEPGTVGHVALLQLENCPQLSEHNLLSDDPSKHVSFVHGSASAKIPNAVQPSPRNFQGEILKASEMEVSHIDDDCQRDLYSDIARKLPLRVNKDSSHDNAKHIQLDNLDLSPQSVCTAKKSKTEHNEIGASDSVLMKGNSSDHEIVNIETAMVDAGKSIPSMAEIREKEINEDLYKTLSSNVKKIAEAGAPKTLQSKPAAEKIHNIEIEELVGYSDSSNWKKFTKPAKCTTDGQENIFSSNVTSEQLKDDQLVTSLGSKKGQKIRKRTSSVPSDQAAIPESTPTQNIEEEQTLKGNLKIGFKVLDNLSDLATVPRESIQPESFSRPSVPTQKGTHSDLIDEVLEGSKRACSLEGNEEGKMSAVDQTAEHGVNGKTSSMKLQAANMENFASPVIIGLDDMNKVTSQAPDENIHLGSLDYVALQTDRKGHEEIELNHDHEAMPSERCKPSDEGDDDGTNKASILMPEPIATSGPMETVTSDVKRNKKRAKKKASAMQTDSVAEQTNMAGANSSDGPNLNAEDHNSEKTDKNESMLHPAETDQTNKVEEERGLSANLDPKGKTSECFKPAGCGEAEVPTREAVHPSDLLGSNEAMDVGNSTGKKRKKRKTKSSAAKVQGMSEMEHNLETVSAISLSVKDVAFGNQASDYEKKSESNVPCMGTYQTTAILGDKGLSMEHGIDQTTAILGDKGLSMGRGTQVTSRTGSKPLHLGETNSNINDSATSPMLSEAKDVKSGSRWKKSRTTKSAIINQDGSEMELVNTLNGLSALTDSPANNVADETKNAQSIQSRNVWKDASNDESMDTSASGSHKEGDKVTQNKAVFLPSTEIDRSQEDRDISENGREVLKKNRTSIDNGIHDLPVEGQTNEVQGPQLNQSGRLKMNDSNVDKKAKKKKKKNQISAAEILSSSEIKEQNLVAEELAALDDKTKGMDSPSCATKTSQLAKRRTVIQSTASDLEVEKNAGNESNSSNPEHAPKNANLFEVPFMGRPETEIDNRNNIETAKSEDKGINFRHYFVPGQHQDKVASSVKVKENLRSRKPKRKKEKHNVVAENKLEASENHGNQNKSDGRNVDDNRVEESGSSDEQNKVLLSGNKRTSKASEDGVKAPSYHEVEGEKILEKASRTAPALLEKNNGTLTAPSPSSSSKGSKRVVSNTSRRKQQSRSNHNTICNGNNFSKSPGDVLNSSGREKSLLTTPWEIFREDSVGSSSDGNKIVNSDASTGTPSDSSSSSGYSVGESELSQDSKRNGSVNATRKGGGAGNILNAKFSAPREMSMDLLLRSSSRFKKAKLAASQSQAGDTETQSVDFVPDSQANQ